MFRFEVKMNYHLLILLIATCSAHDINKRSIFSWGSEDKEPTTAKYLPMLKIHKYNGVQIHPINGPPVYLNQPDSNNQAQINDDQIQTLDLINRLSSFLPEDDKLQEADLTALLPYVDLISEDTLDTIRYAAETNATKQKSKLLKFVAFIKHIKEKKLKPFKYAASLGSKIVHKKKEKVAWLFGSKPSTTPEPYTETVSPVSYPSYPSYPYNLPYNPYFVQKQYYYTTPQPESLQFPAYPYPQYYQTAAKPSPSTEAPQSNPEPQYQAKLPAPLPQFPINFLSESRFPAPQFQFNQPPELPSFPIQSYPSLPTAEPSRNELSYEYKQTPASTYAADNNAIRQVIESTNNTFSSAAPRNEASTEQYYSLQSNNIPFNSQTINIPRIQTYLYQKSAPEPNKFYYTPTYSQSDLSASGSENVEKVEKPEEKIEVSTEILKTKSTGSRTILRPVTSKTPVYEAAKQSENQTTN